MIFSVRTILALSAVIGCASANAHVRGGIVSYTYEQLAPLCSFVGSLETGYWLKTFAGKSRAQQ